MTSPARIGPVFSIDAPDIEPPAAGLISLARQPDVDSDGRWMLGYTYRPDVPSGNARNRSALDGFYGPNLGGTSSIDARVEVVPVYLTTEIRESTLGSTANDHVVRGRRVLEAYTSKLLAHELWTGVIADHDGSPNPRLASAATVNVTPGGGAALPKPQAAVGILMQALADNGMGDGMVHCSRRAGIQVPDGWRNEETLSEQGFVVVSDAGYPGTGPTGQGGQWMYATEIVNVRLGDIEVVPTDTRDSVNTASNTYIYRAQRVGAADFAGPVFACQVDA